MIHIKNDKTRLFSLALFLSILFHPQISDTTLRPKIPLIYRVMKADYIVVGRLTDVREQAVYIYHENFSGTGKRARLYLDTGTLLATKILYPTSMTQQNLSPAALIFPFASHSRSHPQGNGNHMKSSAHFHFDEGAEGIWILERTRFVDHFSVVRPDNLLPIDSLKAVEKAIAQFSNFISEQRPKK